jgi:hypothetical protein
MPEPKATPLEKIDDRPTMHKRVERKEDGRTLIYYTFDDGGAVENSNSRAVKESNIGADKQ